MFFTGVCVSTGVSASVYGGIHPLEQTPPEADPPGSRHPPGNRHPPGADTPLWADTPLGADTLPEADPPGSRHPPEQTSPQEQTPPLPPRADTPGVDTPQSRHPPGDGHCCGHYTSYWNAFLLKEYFFTQKTRISLIVHSKPSKLVISFLDVNILFIFCFDPIYVFVLWISWYATS